jgi:DNA-binding beta-propeller fold protein YncE/mono/diheme cytochrome c family protein
LPGRRAIVVSSHVQTRKYYFQLGATAVLSLAAACDDGSGSVPSGGGDLDAGADATVTPEAPCAGWMQPRHRFPAGSTWACLAGGWTLGEAPAGNLNAIVDDAGADRRFTPHLPGHYTFVDAEGAEALALDVVDAAGAPFVQHNYYPSRSLARVGDELWVANVYRPTLTVIGADGAAGASIAVGAWPVALAWAPGMPEVLVAQRGADEVGFVDVATHRIVDALHVGDEPSNLVVSPDGATAYVALATSGQLVVVDVAARRVRARVALEPDLLAMALTPDGTRLFVARHRSGQPGRFPFPDDPLAEERDVFVVDTETLTVTHELIDAGATISDLLVSADGMRLYLAGVDNHTEGPLSVDASHSFVQGVKVFSTADYALLTAVDLSRQPGSLGAVVSPRGLAELDDTLWVAAEGIDATLALDPVTLVERERVHTGGRPRALLADADAHRLYVHGAQGFTLATLDPGGTVLATTTTAVDPRPADVARGQAYFTGQGRSFATTWSCNSCHADGLTDTQVWNAGPVDDRVVARPFVWLEGSYPLGWAGYMYDIFNYAYEVNGNIGVRPVTLEATDLGAYLASLAAPPAANDATTRDGRLDAPAARGKLLFEGAAGCAGCHALPLTTSRARLDEGITPGVSDVPVLVGAYRYGTWLKHGEARTLRDAVLAAHAFAGGEVLSTAQIDDLTAFVASLTGRDLFVLTTTPRDGDTAIAADQPIVVTFSRPLWDAPANLARVRLVDGAGAPVATTATLSEDGRHLSLAPVATLAFAADYRLQVDAALESYDERHAVAAEVAWTTAHAPSVALDGAYVWTVALPRFQPGVGFDPTMTTPVPVPVTATPTASGALLHFDLGFGLTLDRHAVVDGGELRLPPTPVPIGPSFGDSIPDAPASMGPTGAAGTFTLSGPGFLVPGVGWTFTPDEAR